MQNSSRFMSSLVAASLIVAASPAVSAFAQNSYLAAAGASPYTQEAPAPIERSGTPQNAQVHGAQVQGEQQPSIISVHPAHGITVRADSATEVKTVASDAQHTELRLERGIADVIVRNPAPDMLVLVDLPGGQTQLLKDGFYTFNASTNTARVFSGEADAFANTSDKPTHVKGGDQVVFAGGRARVSYSDPYNARADVLSAGMNGGYEGQGPGSAGDGYGAPGYTYGEGYGGFGEGYVADGGYGDYPYAYGYPYGYYGGWGYPFGIGLGFGYGFGGYGYGGYGYRGGIYRGGGFGGGYGGHGYPGGGAPHPGGSFGGGSFGGGFHGGSGGGVSGGGAAHGGGGGGHR
jgi:hypothetical protein